MPLREWAKKHLPKTKPKEDEESTDSEKETPPTTPPGGGLKVYRSDTQGITPLQIPDTGTSTEKGALTASPVSPSPRSSKFSLSKLGARHRSTSQNSLPDWSPPDESDPNAERHWEERATKLAKLRPTSMTASTENLVSLQKLAIRDDPSTQKTPSEHGDAEPEVSTGWAPVKVIDGMTSDEALQEAIRLHEAGELEEATELFRKIAEQPGNDDNRVIGQVLYGLALRHGWGCEANMSKAVVYLKAAAENAANAEDDALAAGLTKGGNLKGELTLAIFELGNCFRNGWGVEKDNKAARQYFETAAHLGDPEAAVEAAWHWMNGVGCKRNKKQAAKYYRLGEKAGKKEIGNSWIWKDKYN